MIIDRSQVSSVRQNQVSGFRCLDSRFRVQGIKHGAWAKGMGANIKGIRLEV
jgi:hypothetical protein